MHSNGENIKKLKTTKEERKREKKEQNKTKPKNRCAGDKHSQSYS